MKLTELKTPEAVTFRDVPCRLLTRSIIAAREGRIVCRNGRFEFVAGDGTGDPAIYSFSFENEQDAQEIIGLIQQRRQNLAYATYTPAPGQDEKRLFRLHIAFFHCSRQTGRWTVVLTSDVEQALQKKGLLHNPQMLPKILEENFLLHNGRESCFAYTVGKYDPEEFVRYGRPPRPKGPSDEEPGAPLPEQPENLPEHAAPPPEPSTAPGENEFPRPVIQTPPEETAIDQRKIRIYGKDFSLQLCRKTERSGKEYLLAESVDVLNRRTAPMELGMGQLVFEEGAAFFSESIRRELDSISGYLDLWGQYTSVEGDFLLRRAREVGMFSLHPKWEVSGEGVNVYPAGLSGEQWGKLSEGEWLRFSSETPPYLEDLSMTWQQYRRYRQELETSRDGRTPEFVVREIMRVNRESGCLTLDNRQNQGPPPLDGVAALSIRGDESQITRREKARERIDSGEAANPALGLIIEGRLPEMTDRPAAQRPIEPMSAFVLEKIFAPHKPTPTQEEAIRIALNTPDIAIIQGPPGTGKTKVITAIIERLNELADPRRDNRGSVLVTSFQHAAVRNICERLSVNSLLTIKFGSQNEEDQTMQQAVETWCLNYAEALRKKNPSIRVTEAQQNLTRVYHEYFVYPSDTAALRFLEQAKAVDTSRRFAKEIEALKQEIQLQDPDGASSLTELIRRLRTTRNGFLDDGPDRAYDLLCALEDMIGSGGSRDLQRILTALDQASLWEGEPTEELLADLKSARQELLRRCIPKPVYRIEQPRTELIDLYQRIARTLQQPQDEMDNILSDLLSELENNSMRIEAAIEGYNFAYAATTQQCEGKDIRRAKGVRNPEEHPEYSTVIVDEAARVNPGDLMIPMAQASRRIILVGDHRQLPHVYDEEIFESMAERDGSINKEAVKESMFQYLIKKAEELTAEDHIPRTITLDAQYRTHRLLGNFVSQNFYEPHSQKEKFVSPPPEADQNYRQDLWPKPVKWVDLPPSAGPMGIRGTSKFRLCEADYIANTLADYLKSNQKTPDGKDLKYGVITFYREQCDLIRRRLLKRLGAKELPKQVQIGSVDAFQGMEFDVIFLSIVRCRNVRGGPDVDWELLEKDVSQCSRDSSEYRTWARYRESAGMKHYGFLSFENRLCVAMSRQIRLLILVGDSGAFDSGSWGRLAQSCIPAMRNMVELCKREEVLVDGQAKGRQSV